MSCSFVPSHVSCGRAVASVSVCGGAPDTHAHGLREPSPASPRPELGAATAGSHPFPRRLRPQVRGRCSQLRQTGRNFSWFPSFHWEGAGLHGLSGFLGTRESDHRCAFLLSVSPGLGRPLLSRGWGGRWGVGGPCTRPWAQAHFLCPITGGGLGGGLGRECVFGKYRTPVYVCVRAYECVLHCLLTAKVVC